MSTRLFVNLSQVFIPLYLHETLNMTASALALIPLIMFIGSFLTSLTIEKLNRGFGRKVILKKYIKQYHMYIKNQFAEDTHQVKIKYANTVNCLKVLHLVFILKFSL